PSNVTGATGNYSCTTACRGLRKTAESSFTLTLQINLKYTASIPSSTLDFRIRRILDAIRFRSHCYRFWIRGHYDRINDCPQADPGIFECRTGQAFHSSEEGCESGATGHQESGAGRAEDGLGPDECR